MAMSYGSPGSFTAEFAGPFSAGVGGTVKFTTISLPASSWKGASSPFSQAVNVEGVSANSMVNLSGDAQTLALLIENRTAVYLENDVGTVTAVAVGKKPTANLTLDAIIIEGVVTT